MRQGSKCRCTAYVYRTTVSRLAHPRRVYRQAHVPRGHQCLKFMTCNAVAKDWAAYANKVYFADLARHCRARKID